VSTTADGAKYSTNRIPPRSSDGSDSAGTSASTVSRTDARATEKSSISGSRVSSRASVVVVLSSACMIHTSCVGVQTSSGRPVSVAIVAASLLFVLPIDWVRGG
jgi:hypothetical protein